MKNDKPLGKVEYFKEMKSRLKTEKELILNFKDLVVFLNKLNKSTNHVIIDTLENYLVNHTNSSSVVNNEYLSTLSEEELTILDVDLLAYFDYFTDSWPLEQEFDMSVEDVVGWRIFKESYALSNAIISHLRKFYRTDTKEYAKVYQKHSAKRKPAISINEKRSSGTKNSARINH